MRVKGHCFVGIPPCPQVVAFCEYETKLKSLEVAHSMMVLPLGLLVGRTVQKFESLTLTPPNILVIIVK